IQVDWSDAHGAVHDSVNFSVKITQRQPISVELVVPPKTLPETANNAPIQVPEGGLNVKVLVTTPSPTDYVEIEPAAGTGSWFPKRRQATQANGQWVFEDALGMTIPGSEVPKDLSVTVREGYVGGTTETRFGFHTIAFTGTNIEIFEPPQDQ